MEGKEVKVEMPKAKYSDSKNLSFLCEHFGRLKVLTRFQCNKRCDDCPFLFESGRCGMEEVIILVKEMQGWNWIPFPEDYRIISVWEGFDLVVGDYSCVGVSCGECPFWIIEAVLLKCGLVRLRQLVRQMKGWVE